MVDYNYENITYAHLGTIYGISMEEERSIWRNCYRNKYIYITSDFPNCNIGKVNLVTFNSMLNPLKGGCNKANCGYRFYLRKYSIFADFPKISV